MSNLAGFKGKVHRKNELKRYLFLLMLFFVQNAMADSTWFITKWRTTTANEDIIIPTNSGSYTYNYEIDCDNDGTFEQTGITGDGTCTFSSAGEHIINIQGTFPAIYINNETEKDKILEVIQWGNIAWKNMNAAFYGASNLQITATDSPNLSNVADMNSMFRDAIAFNSDISGWDVSNVVNMTYMFSGAVVFNQPLNSWDVGNVTNMSHMFRVATAFNQPLNSWDVSNVSNMAAMFRAATAFNSDISSWIPSSATNTSYMFESATAFNQNIGSWDVSSAINMGYMFNNATSFNQDINNWNVSNATTMGLMFANATAFNQDISGWNVSSATNMSSMFAGATAFNQNISGWNVSSAINMAGMFAGTTAFNQNISGWTVGGVTNMTNMFSGVTLSTANYDALLVGWDSLTLQTNVTFHGGNSICTFGSAAEAARTNMTSTDSWTITDGGCKTAQIITFTNPGSKILTDSLTLSATSDSGLNVSYASTTTPVCTVNASTGETTFVSAGQCSITASQAGNASYAPANDVTQTFTISKVATTTTITSDNPDPSKIDRTVTINFTIIPASGSNPTGDVTVTDGTDSCTATLPATSCDITFLSDGTKSLTTTYAGDINFNGSVSPVETHEVLADEVIPSQPIVLHNLKVEKTGNGTITTSYGINCGSDCENDYADQTELTLTAIPDSGWIFDGWTGDCDENGEVRINKDKTCTVNFVQEHILTITVEGEGIVNDCGISCTQTYLSSKIINLTTTSELATIWSGDCDENGNVTMDGDKTCIATFIEGYPLTIAIPTAKGTVKTETQECLENCEEIVVANTITTLIAEPEIEWVLDSFSGDCDTNGTVNMISEKSCTANFIKDPNIPNNGD
ncbi:MAG: BspA family leucine-rich repeat surface protein, partial [Candidatus Marithrix sp.]